MTEIDWANMHDTINTMSEEDLDDVASWIKERRAVLKAQVVRSTMASLEVGDGVRIKHDAPLRPRYLLGAEGKVHALRLTKITVKMNDDIYDPYGKWAGKLCVVGAEHLEPVK